MPQEIIDILKGQGLAGVVIFFQAWAIYRLYNRNQELHDTVKELGMGSVRTNEQNTNVLSQMTEVNRSTVGAIAELKSIIERLYWRSGGDKGQE